MIKFYTYCTRQLLIFNRIYGLQYVPYYYVYGEFLKMELAGWRVYSSKENHNTTTKLSQNDFFRIQTQLVLHYMYLCYQSLRIQSYRSYNLNKVNFICNPFLSHQSWAEMEELHQVFLATNSCLIHCHSLLMIDGFLVLLVLNFAIKLVLLKKKVFFKNTTFILQISTLQYMYCIYIAL